MLKRNFYQMAILTGCLFCNLSIQAGNLVTENLDSSCLELFYSMGLEGQMLVYQLANQECKGLNACKGLNYCKNEGKNHCAGMCTCRGKSKSAFLDKNTAVKVVEKKMAEKRVEMTFETFYN